MIDYQPKEHEVIVPLQAVGIQYQCEFCNEGFMMADVSKAPQAPIIPGGRPLIWHVCSKCKKTMLLPDVYPKVEYLEITTAAPEQSEE